MPKFRKKPVEIEAEQFHGVGHYEAKGAPYPRGVCFCSAGFVDAESPHAHLHTIHAGQTVNLAVGDWIVPEADGEHFYPIKPDVFARTYDPVTG